MPPSAPPPEPDPEFGPGGYLPERAAKRARKIVLREQMGLQWPIAAVVAAVLVLVAGGVFLATGTGPPDPPFAPVLAIDEVDPRGAEVLAAGSRRADLAAPRTDLAVVRAGGGVRVFRVPTDAVAFCTASGRLEAPGGAVWNTNGRLVGGPGESLQPVAAQVYDGVLYVDETAAAPRLPAEAGTERPQCAAAAG
jgi:hypothetical protein